MARIALAASFGVESVLSECYGSERRCQDWSPAPHSHPVGGMGYPEENCGGSCPGGFTEVWCNDNPSPTGKSGYWFCRELTFVDENISVSCPNGPDNCYHSDWSVPWSCAANAQDCWNSGGDWYPDGQVALKAKAGVSCPNGPDNCYHSDWSAPWSCAANAQDCWNSGGDWYPDGQVALKAKAATSCPNGPDNCYHSDWSVPWSCAANAQDCWNSGGDWYPDGQVALKAKAGVSCPNGPDNCYHSDWSVPWSCAANAQDCWNSGGDWYPDGQVELEVAQAAVSSECYGSERMCQDWSPAPHSHPVGGMGYPAENCGGSCPAGFASIWCNDNPSPSGKSGYWFCRHLSALDPPEQVMV